MPAIHEPIRLAALVLLALAILVPLRAIGQPVTARLLFSAQAHPSPGPSAPIGTYTRGCMAGGVELPETGETWQAMRLSRNRNWGQPETVAFIRRLSAAAQRVGWPRLFVGDISQPRGGPMRSGHRSHQIGLDVDIWLRAGSAMPLSRAKREQVGSASVVAPDRRQLNSNWTTAHTDVLRASAEDAAVARIFVNAAIKQHLCESLPADDRAWLRKLRPWWGHDAHFHVRLACPVGLGDCEGQPLPPAGDGCDDTLAWWFTDEALHPKPGKPKPALTLADLPPACRGLVAE